jgi:hypothetical protein
MNVEELELFTNNIQEILMLEGKQIIVPRVVCMELLRHFAGADDRKKKIAVEVFDVLCRHEKIFCVQNTDIGDVDLMKAFADVKLLAELTENKSSCSQLLITNDRKLSRDAYDLNNLESCKGHSIKVCYLNHFGELHRCECVKEAQRQSVSTEPKKVVKEVVKVETQKEKEPYSWIFRVGVPAAILLMGFTAGKYGDRALKYIKKMV